MNQAQDLKLSITAVTQLLQNAGHLSAEHLAEIKQKGMNGKSHPVSAIESYQFTSAIKPELKLDEEFIMGLLAQESKLEYFTIDPLKVKASEVTPTMSFAFAKRHGLLPVAISRDQVTVATAEPYDHRWIEDIEHINRRQVGLVLAKPTDIQRYQVEFFSLAASVSGASALHQKQGSNLESLVELGTKTSSDANDEHIINIVDWLFQYAFEQRASDIHVEPRREISRVRFRIDGVLHPVYEFPATVSNAVTSRIKSLGRMNIAEKRKPQDSRIKTRTPNGYEVELRLSTMPTAFGEKLVMRIFDPDVLLRNFSELGFSKEDNQHWDNMVHQTSGIVLVTGPTGSGKTTTLYSTLKQLATEEVNVCTVEDPIEMVEPTFNQMQVNSSIGLNFASGIRTLMRQDPDIVMVGEIRDSETAEMAIQAALTGHLVLSTLHTNDAPSAIARLQHIGVPHYLIKSAVTGVMAQRLIRTLCPHCKQKQAVDGKMWDDLVKPWSAKAPDFVYEPIGCLECRNTGYKGRAGLYEVMPMNDTLAELIQVETDMAQLRRQAMKDGMRNLRLSGAQKVAAGLTTIEEVLRVTPAEMG
ncbi:GspE/PulE family protein [Oceaniserpentilla sp. 4NH20-0058]|uniref:GspE/PulE family protein n=1 Tax=Oceaniserpentilla sp. 4NH20-0058 TaxID=3127660 RepID=UPI00310223EB